MEFDEVIKKRKSVRSFKSKVPSWKQVLEAIEAALQAPSAGNMNHFKFIIIEDKETINKLADYAHQNWISECGILIAVCSDDTYLEKEYGERGRVYSRQQAGAAIENLLLKITDLGLSACWVGAYSDEMVKDLLKVPQHIQIEALIPIGYESGRNPYSQKKPLESSIYWEIWDRSKRPTFTSASEPPLLNYGS